MTKKATNQKYTAECKHGKVKSTIHASNYSPIYKGSEKFTSLSSTMFQNSDPTKLKEFIDVGVATW